MLLPLLPLTTILVFTLPTAVIGQQCVTQGAGNCQFVMTALEPPVSDIEYDLTLYSHTCAVIGEAGDINPGDAISSQLRYTVDILSRGGAGPDIYATFAYAGGTYGRGISSWARGDCSEGLSGCSWIRSAFPCPAF